MQEVVERILSRTKPGPNGCIEFTGYRNHQGYGQVSLKGKLYRAHRLMWIAARGPLTATEFVCHRCDNPGCVNIEHLWIGSNAANTADRDRKGRNWGQKLTHCKRGHELTPENTLRHKYKGYSHRKCRECAAEKARGRNAYHKAYYTTNRDRILASQRQKYAQRKESP